MNEYKIILIMAVIKNHLTASVSGELPGKWDGFAWVFPKLIYHGMRRQVLHWVVKVELLSFGAPVQIKSKYLDRPNWEFKSNNSAQITTISWQESGKIRDSSPKYVLKGKNIGKGNETNCLTQALNEARSDYNRQLKKVVVRKDRYPPMLIKWRDKSQVAVLTENDYKSGLTVQPKFNGVRAVAFKSNSEIVLYSRHREDYNGCNGIKKELSNIPEGTYIDGELFREGKSLSWISGQARLKEGSEELTFYMFDLFIPSKQEMPSHERQTILSDMFKEGEYKSLVRVKNAKANTSSDITKLYDDILREGYEGIVIRRDALRYVYSYGDYHTSNVLKQKPVFDSEYKCVGYTEGIQGKEVGAIIWLCEVGSVNIKDPSDIKFSVEPKGLTYEDRYKLFKCFRKNEKLFQDELYGRNITVYYNEISEKTGKPLQAKASGFRVNDHDPLPDIIKRCG